MNYSYKEQVKGRRNGRAGGRRPPKWFGRGRTLPRYRLDAERNSFYVIVDLRSYKILGH